VVIPKFFVIQMGRMGDIVQSLPLLKRLKQDNSPCEITLLCIREPVELIRQFAPVDRFVSIPYAYYKKLRARQNPLSGLDFLLDIPELRESYDLVINLTHDLLAASLCDSIRGARKSGMTSRRDGRIFLRGDWGKYLFSVVTDRINRAENLFNLVDIHIGMGGLPHKAMDSWLDVGPQESRRADRLLVDNGWKRGPLVALQMGASQPHRAWPVKYFVELGAALSARPGVELVLLGGPRETGLAEEFLRRSKRPAINLIAKTRVADLPSIVQKCALLVSNDTGTAHIAAAVGARVLGLYFSTAYFGETAPFGAHHLVLQVETECTPCLNDRCSQTWCRDFLDVQAVKLAAEMMLSGPIKPLPDFPNLSIHHSRFLSNGTLVYAPVTPKISESYQAALINRILWENALGLEHDPAFLTEFWPKLLPLESFRAKLQERRAEFASLGALYHESLKIIHQAAIEAGAGSSREYNGSGSLARLQEIDATISAIPNSLLPAFHRFEMMGINCSNHPETDYPLVEKYAKLYSLVTSFIALLDIMDTAPHVGA
jgi:ADP-heptose:LPS heptosyltransferase